MKWSLRLKGMRPGTGTLLPLGLASLLVVQLYLLRDRMTVPYQYEPIELGRVLPFAVNGWDQAATSSEGIETCRLAFLCRRGCGACDALAARYVSQVAQGTEAANRPLWLIWGDSAEAASWAEEHAVSAQAVLSLAPVRRTLFGTPVIGDVWVTPTRLVLTSSLLVMDARPADEVPTDSVVQELCRGGGIAPRNLAEYWVLMNGG